jgi:hypothetical protein
MGGVWEGLAVFLEVLHYHLHCPALLFGTKHQVDAINGPDLGWTQLGIAPRHDNEGSWILTNKFVDCLTALVVGHLGYATRIHVTQVGPFALSGSHNPVRLKLRCHG